MLETLSALPIPFLLALTLLLCGAAWSIAKVRTGIGIPTLAVLATVAAWYVIDVLYNDYDRYIQEFSQGTLSTAWWEVVVFLTVFLFLVPAVHGFVNVPYLSRSSSVRHLFKHGVDDRLFQQRLGSLLRGSLVIWGLISLVAAIRLGSDLPYYFFPFLDHKVDPWARARLGTGMDAMLSLAGYLQLFVTASFGVVAALEKTPSLRRIALVACAIAWPYFIFDRTRNVMLSAVLPAALTWTLLRLRANWITKGAVLAGIFLLINAWFGFVIANRANMTITEALRQQDFSLSDNSKVHHEGLNMYEELCWINSLMADQIFQPRVGERYFAEIVNPIPRALWPDKPLVGIDYAIARGQSYAAGDGGVGASLSTGMIGQGVVNFGPVFGPPFAALLMSLWVAMLARLDLQGKDITLYGLGLILTFNLGRDITLLTLYVFVSGAVAIYAINRLFPPARAKSRPSKPMGNAPSFQQQRGLL